jgi:hypothetical protein
MGTNQVGKDWGIDLSGYRSIDLFKSIFVTAECLSIDR